MRTSTAAGLSVDSTATSLLEVFPCMIVGRDANDERQSNNHQGKGGMNVVRRETIAESEV